MKGQVILRLEQDYPPDDEPLQEQGSVALVSALLSGSHKISEEGGCEKAHHNPCQLPGWLLQLHHEREEQHKTNNCRFADSVQIDMHLCCNCCVGQSDVQSCRLQPNTRVLVSVSTIQHVARGKGGEGGANVPHQRGTLVRVCSSRSPLNTGTKCRTSARVGPVSPRVGIVTNSIQIQPTLFTYLDSLKACKVQPGQR